MDYYLTQTKKIREMSGVKTFTWGIPAFRSESGFVTCPYAGKCAKGCYARQGYYVFPKVQAAYEKRLALSKTKSFIAIIDDEIKRRGIKRIRVHDSGDFYSLDYAQDWLEIAEKNKSVAFYAYTKAIPIVSQFTWPKNFRMIYSEGGKRDDLIKESDRHARIFSSVEELKASGYSDAHKNDSNALGKNTKVGLVYHGHKIRQFKTGVGI